MAQLHSAAASTQIRQDREMLCLVRSILIIDDEDDIREVAALSLEAVAGWTVHTARSGADGIASAKQLQPDAILMDVIMPGMDGPATFKAMQQTKEIEHIPVILLTARVQGADQRRFADLGVAAVILKPFDPLLLSTQIADALGWKDEGKS